MKCDVVVFNGPPSCGKGEAADYCTKIMNDEGFFATHKEFKEKLFRLVLEIYDVDRSVFFALYNNRQYKETPSDLFGGLSPRQAMIKVSEEVIKPVYGKDYFGKSAAKKINEGANFFSDGGFQEEIVPVMNVANSMTIVRLTRPGCTFKGDSRNYLDKEMLPDVEFVDIHNDSDIDCFKNQLELFLYEWKIKHGYN